MSSWPLRRKLIALVSIPMVVLIATGAFLGVQTALDYRSARTVHTLADLAIATIDTSITLRQERSVAGGGDEGRAQLTTARTAVDRSVNSLRSVLADPPGDAWPARVRSSQATALTALGRLTSVRGTIDAAADRSPVQVDGQYSPLADAVDDLVTSITTDLASETGDTATADDAATLGAVSRVATAASRERYLLGEALTAGKVSDGDRGRLSLLAATQTDQFEIAVLRATASQRAAIMRIGDDDTRLGQFRTSTEQENTDRAAAGAAFTTFADTRIRALDTVSQDLASDTQTQAASVERGQLLKAAVMAALVLLTLISVATVLAVIARSVTAPLRRLWTGAIDVASVQLPAAVARIERDGVDADVSLSPVLPAGAAAGPETLEVARAVDDLGAEAVRLATAQVRLRRALDEAFVSMSRRSQSMVEKQLAIIDELERIEQDPDQLRNLFRLDHLAARMRRYNDNLLVLAGSAVRTRTTSPVKVAELFRAATSEMEHYERVRLQPVGGASIAGTVAGELIHLVAELLDNAAMYSPPTSPIVLSATVTVQGGLQLEIVDSGVGISPGELDRLNARLAHPEGIDTQVPSRMGLFVVARLAQRGGFGVSLRPRPDASGTVAEVLVPPALVLGTAGRTGEQPMLGGARRGLAGTSAAGFPARSVPSRADSFGDSAGPGAPLPHRTASPATPAPQQRPAAAAAPAAAPAPAATRTTEVSEVPDATPLPRRTRGVGVAPGTPPVLTPGGELWPEANGSDLVPLGGPDLFTPAVPPEAEATPGPVAPSSPGRPAETGMPAAPAPVMRSRGPELATDSFAAPARPVTPQTSPTGIPLSPLSSAAPLDADVPGRTTPGSSPLSSWGSGTRSRQSPLPPNSTDSPAAPTAPTQPSVGRGDGELPRRPRPLTDPRPATNTAVPTHGSGASPAAWDDALPTELAARNATAANYATVNPTTPLIGHYDSSDADVSSPIFDSISVWFADDDVAAPTEGQVIDLRDEGQPTATRWSSLGDQRWLATNARASAAPETAGTTASGLPRRRPGANLLPSALNAAADRPSHATPARATPAPTAPAGPAPSAATPAAPTHGARPAAATPVDRDADRVRGRLGSYQRGLATARRTRPQAGQSPAFQPAGASLFTSTRASDDDGADHDHSGGSS